MADGGVMVIDGVQLRDPDLRLPLPDGAVTGSRVLELADAEASARLFGLRLPEARRSAALRQMNADGDNFLSLELSDAEAIEEKLREYLLAIADGLKDEPLVISILDGSALRLFLEDEDDFAMMAESLFTDLDTGDVGKLSKSQIKDALVHMGAEMGVPPFSESSTLLNDILKKHGAEGEEHLGQAQFAQLLQPILQDLADALAVTHVTVIHNIKVVNGSKLRMILTDEKLFNDVAERMFHEWDAYQKGRNGEGNQKMLRGFLEVNALEFGLPPSESNEAVVLLYDQIFSHVNDEKITGDIYKDTFQVVLKDILEKFGQKLEENPIFVDLES